MWIVECFQNLGFGGSWLLRLVDLLNSKGDQDRRFQCSHLRRPSRMRKALFGASPVTEMAVGVLTCVYPRGRDRSHRYIIALAMTSR